LTTFHLHLNGGPRDDQYVAHWDDILWVEKLSNLQDFWTTNLGLSPTLIETRRGHYRVRHTDLGHVVPHSRGGFVEADWQGWDK
jgi:hypothetical protein